MKRAFALLFMVFALYFIYKGNKRSSEEKEAHPVKSYKNAAS